MLGGFLEFFMRPSLANTYLALKTELDQLIQTKLEHPRLENKLYENLISAIRLLVSKDECEGRFVPNHQVLSEYTQAYNGEENSKSQLRRLINRAGYKTPVYNSTMVEIGEQRFVAKVGFGELEFEGKPCETEKDAEEDAAHEALMWLQREAKMSVKFLL
ncbi:DExH-box ATP-dependent RNA helicase DExH3 [Eutrema salsugineum]|nr:DExH-box ATP-dependent RNA helicase DExH3 [Eutrema salsugineum]XP_024015619.1 DExH-box ATP-dependent RNA helicase DExH3 [Eutrema salsugineum]